MDPLGLEEFDAQSAEFDRLVAATPDIDHFCSSTDWIVPAARALMAPRTPWLFRGAGCQIALMRAVHPEGWPYLEPLEAMWGLACPVVGPDSASSSRQLGELLRQGEAEFEAVVLLGLPLPSRLLGEVARSLAGRYELRQGPITSRCVASLAGGLDGYLGRRSRNFRKALRQALRLAHNAGIEFQSFTTRDPEEALLLYQRAIEVEQRSWKGRAGSGIESGTMHEFYATMVPRLARRGALSLWFARDPRRAKGSDVAFVLGGVFGTSYRGLQFSFDDEYRPLALGNLCQYHQIAELCSQGVMSYDLGTDMEYKRRWAETRRDSLGLIAIKR